MVRQRSIRFDHAADDLGHGVRPDDVDPLEGSDDRALGRAERRRDRGETDIGAPPGRGLIERIAQTGERPLAPRRREIRCLRLGRSVVAVTRVPFGDFQPRVDHPVGELPADRDLDPDEIDTGADHRGRLVERCLDVGLMERDPEPRPPGLAEHPDGLAADDALRIDAVDGRGHQPRRFRLGDDPPVALAQELALERQVDRPGCDVERQLLRVEVVFERGPSRTAGRCPTRVPAGRRRASGRWSPRPAGAPRRRAR